jgi:hypothetical protein
MANTLTDKDITNIVNGTQDITYYGYHYSELSYKQIMAAYNFEAKVQPWLEENIGKFNENWFVEVDKEFDSLRITFDTPENEMYFKLGWMQRDEVANKTDT